MEAYVSVGTPETAIARILSIDPKTLRKYYADTIATARHSANATVAGTLFKEATGYFEIGADGKQKQTRKPNVIAQIFWLKTRGGWREQDRAGGSGGSSGAPMPGDEGAGELGSRGKVNVGNLNPEQQRQLRALLALAKRPGKKAPPGGAK